jgi:hypothetical protein
MRYEVIPYYKLIFLSLGYVRFFYVTFNRTREIPDKPLILLNEKLNMQVNFLNPGCGLRHNFYHKKYDHLRYAFCKKQKFQARDF